MPLRLRFFSIFLLLVSCTGARADWTLNVAPGADALELARDVIREARKNGELKQGEKAVVEIQAGTYPVDRTVKFSAADGGLVTYRAAKPGTVRLIGGIELKPAAFSKVTDPDVLKRLDPSAAKQILVADLSNLYPGSFPAFSKAYRGTPAAPWLYVDDVPQTLARWPNSDWARFSKVVDSGKANPSAEDPALRKSRPGSFVFSDPRPKRWNLEEGVWLFGYWTHDWSYEVIRIDSYDAQKQVIRLAAPHGYGIASGTWGGKERRFFALNVLEELDSAGEWFPDRKNKKLYYFPGKNWKDARIVLGTLTTPIVEVEAARDLRFEGLNFEFAHSTGVRVKNSESVVFAGCTFSNLAGSGITISGGKDNVVRSCDLYNIGSTGVSMSGGDRKSLTRSNHIAENNHIHHYGRFQRTYAPGVGVSGCGQIVRNNTIRDAPHNAILYSGNEHLFEKNDISRVVLETGDSGAFYTGRDWTSQGNVLRHNFIHHLGGGEEAHVNTMGVYLDDCDSGDTIEGNIFYRAGRAIMIGGGRDNIVLNNLVFDCPIGMHMDSRGMSWKQWNDPKSPGWHLEGKAEAMNYRQSPWSDRYPNLVKIMTDSPQQPLHNVIRRNVFVNTSKTVWNFDTNVKNLLGKLDVAGNYAFSSAKPVEGIKGFEEREGSVFPAAETAGDSPDFEAIIKQVRELVPSFQTIPFGDIGIYSDQYRTVENR